MIWAVIVAIFGNTARKGRLNTLCAFAGLQKLVVEQYQQSASWYILEHCLSYSRNYLFLQVWSYVIYNCYRRTELPIKPCAALVRNVCSIYSNILSILTLAASVSVLTLLEISHFFSISARQSPYNISNNYVYGSFESILWAWTVAASSRQDSHASCAEVMRHFSLWTSCPPNIRVFALGHHNITS